jgi:hypothetical protein
MREIKKSTEKSNFDSELKTEKKPSSSEEKKKSIISFKVGDNLNI